MQGRGTRSPLCLFSGVLFLLRPLWFLFGWLCLRFGLYHVSRLSLSFPLCVVFLRVATLTLRLGLVAPTRAQLPGDAFWQARTATGRDQILSSDTNTCTMPQGHQRTTLSHKRQTLLKLRFSDSLWKFPNVLGLGWTGCCACKKAFLVTVLVTC